MTQTAFVLLCNEYGIDPAIALENDNIVAALKSSDDARIATILSKEF